MAANPGQGRGERAVTFAVAAVSAEEVSPETCWPRASICPASSSESRPSPRPR